MKKLTAYEKRFCDIVIFMELHGEVNHQKAYEMAGYKCRGKTAKTEAYRTLTKPPLKAYLSRARARVKRVIEMTEDEILHEYANLARSNIVGYYNDDGSLKKLSQLTEAQALAIQSIEIEEHEYTNKKGNKGITRSIKLRLHPKKSALDSLAKIKGMMKPDAKDVVNFAMALHEAMKDKE